MNLLMDRSRMLLQLSAAARRDPEKKTDWYSICNAAGEGGDPAEVVLYAEIGWFGKTAQDFMDELRGISASDISLRVNSPGGEIFDGIAIYNLLRSHPANVTAYVDSLAASIASVIVMAADRVVMQPHSQLMIHDASGGCYGNPTDMREMADLLDKQSDNIAGVYTERAGGQLRSWRNRMKEETWYSAAEAVEAGLADEIGGGPMKRKAMPEHEEEGMPMEERASARYDLTVYQFAGLFRYAGREYAPTPMAKPAAGHRARTALDKATAVHHTGTVDRTWDAGQHEGRLPSPITVATANAMYGWYDADQVEDGELPKSACKLPHHEVSADGTPGVANMAGVRNALSRLPQSDIPEADRAAVERHLRAHMEDAAEEEDQLDDEQATEEISEPEPEVEVDETETEEKEAPEAVLTGGEWEAAVARLSSPADPEWLSLVAHLANNTRRPRRPRTTA